MVLDRHGLVTVFDVATAVKRRLGIRRGEQRFASNGEALAMLSELPTSVDDLVLTLEDSACGDCGRTPRRGERKLRVCSSCWDARYCDEMCQARDWKHHRSECGGRN